jgi:NADH-quinone oxidoreductase subunit N
MFLFQVANPDVNLALIAPELIVGVAGVIVMLVDAFTHRRQRNVTAALSILAILGAGAASIWLWTQWPATSAFNGMIVLDELRLSFTIVFLIVAMLTILIATIWLDVEDLPAGEFHSLLLFATCGMMLMASAGDLVIVFLGLEILSIATYVLAGFRRADRRSNESSLKYFILGSFASAFLLYGIALIYGATATGPDQPGTTNIALIAARANQSLYPPLLFAGMAMLLVGFGFKIATAPFHVLDPRRLRRRADAGHGIHGCRP